MSTAGASRSTPPFWARDERSGPVRIDVLTLFPDWFAWFTGQRHVANALSAGHELYAHSFRDHTPLTGGQVDDTPFGGGAGMVLRVDVVDAALRAVHADGGSEPGAGGGHASELRAGHRVVALTATGRLLDDGLAGELAAERRLTLLCGRYEGFDERVVEHLATDAVSIGRYVLAGGELPAMVLLDTLLRKLPGVLGDARSAVEESFSPALGGAPEYPHFTRPASYRGWDVPEILLSGHHERIREWRAAESARLAPQSAPRAASEGARAPSADEDAPLP